MVIHPRVTPGRARDGQGVSCGVSNGTDEAPQALRGVVHARNLATVLRRHEVCRGHRQRDRNLVTRITWLRQNDKIIWERKTRVSKSALFLDNIWTRSLNSSINRYLIVVKAGRPTKNRWRNVRAVERFSWDGRLNHFFRSAFFHPLHFLKKVSVFVSWDLSTRLPIGIYVCQFHPALSVRLCP